MQMNQANELTRPPAPAKTRIAAFIAIIVLADYLIFRQTPGLNLFILSAVVAMAIALAVPRHAQPSTALRQVLLVILVATPLLEAPSFTGLMLVMTH